MKCSDQMRRIGFPVSRCLIARAFVVLNLVCAMGETLGQSTTFKLNPEFESLIREAQSLGVDPVRLTVQRKLSEDVTFDLAEYISDKKKAEAKEREARIAKKDAEAKEREIRNAKLDAELLKQTKVVLAAMKTLEAQGRLDTDVVADLNKMANSNSEEVRVLVRREFGKYLKP